MARIALIEPEPEHANPEVKQIYDGALRGKPGNAQKALAHRPESASATELKKYFPDEHIVDLHLLTGVANLTNRFTDPLGLELEFPEQKV